MRKIYRVPGMRIMHFVRLVHTAKNVAAISLYLCAPPLYEFDSDANKMCARCERPLQSTQLRI